MTSQHQHQQQQHWHPEDIDDALVADFDGSLSGLCIMSLSFDFTRNSTAVAAAAAAAAVATTATTTGAQLQAATGGSLVSSAAQEVSPTGAAHLQHEPPYSQSSESSFKRFKASNMDEPQLMQDNNSKIARQLQKLKSCLNAAAASNPLAAHLSAITQAQHASDRNSPAPSEQAPGPEAEGDEPLSELSRCSSTVDACTPSPASSLSPSTTCSTGPSRQHSPAPPVSNQQDAADKCLALVPSCERAPASLNGSRAKTVSAASVTSVAASAASLATDKQLSVYSVKDSLMNNQGSTLKESSYTTSVMTTSAPMPHTFKSIHHPFHSFKQFPLSPYQFSNSSLNQHDFYDRYLSQHDSHQPLQTPLIGIERTQDLLSLRLPPHGPEEFDSTGGHRFGSTKTDWMFGDNETPATTASSGKETGEPNDAARKSAEEPQQSGEPVFPHFSYSNTNKSNKSVGKREPIDLNVSYLTGESIGFSNNKRSSSASLKSQLFTRASKSNSPHRRTPTQPEQDVEQELSEEEADNASQMAPESMFGVDASKHKFQYILAAPISVATKLSEDTITYLNQGQAYEIKLENLTDVSEAKKGFMCSIINIGFQERHMQQAENELWQQWSQQHPNEKIFSVDMKLSYNVFGVESDGLNKYEFLWDSSKVAGVFIRINSISTEFTPKKHGGEKGVPFKLSIETFSYNSKTHDSYFISAACCQIKVFKPKGAERKIRSDRDKISRRPLQEQDKYHGPCEHSVFHECSLASLHPMADSSLCYYRHSHGHFASKQVVTTTSNTPATSLPTGQPSHSQPTNQHSDDELEASPNKHSSSPGTAGSPPPNHCVGTASNNPRAPSVAQVPVEQLRDFHDSSRCINTTAGNKSYMPHLNYSASRLMHPQNHYGARVESDYSPYGSGGGHQPSAMEASGSTGFNSLAELTPFQQPNHAFNHHQMYHTNHQGVRNPHHHPVINGHHTSHFNMAYHYGHPPPPLSQSASSSIMGFDTSTQTMPANTLTAMAHGVNHFPASHQQSSQVAAKSSSLYHRHQPFPRGDTKLPPPLPPPPSLQSIGGPPPLSSSFRASNLSMSSHNLSSYTPVTSSNDTSLQTTHESPHSFAHSYHHQLATPTTEPLTSCAPHESTGNQHTRTMSSELYYANSNMSSATRHHQSDGYLSSGGGSLPDTVSTPSSGGGGGGSSTTVPASVTALHWMHTSPVHHPNQLTSLISPICGSGGGPTQRGHSLSHNDTHIYNNSAGSHNLFDCNTQNNNNYDSDHNSPQHENQHTSDSSSSCQSRFKNSSLILPPSFINNGSNNSSQQDSSARTMQQPTTNLLQITANSTCIEVKSWLAANRFSLFVKTFSNFSGSDLLRLSKTDLIEICGVIDGIRLFNSLHITQPIKHIFCDQNISLDYHHA